MRFPTNGIETVVNALIANAAYKATKYISPSEVITATRVVYGGRIDGRDSRVDIRVKIGKPNFNERQFIKAALAASEPFPVHRVQIKALPKKRAK